MTAEPSLKRVVGLPLFVLYGLGTTIGAGIYVLIGQVAEAAGSSAPLAFALACLLATFTALSFAELAARFPYAAGEAVYVLAAWGNARLASALGLLVAFTAVVAAATLCRGFVGYLGTVITIQPWVAIVLVVVALGAVVAWGIRQTMILAAISTMVEIAGLLIVAWAGRDHLADLGLRWHELMPEAGGWSGIAAGAVIAFYAFLGFEDMVYLAEEVRDVRRAMPRAIILTLVITLVLYMIVVVVAVLAVAPAELADSAAPLRLILERTGHALAGPITVISLLAVVNGVMVQIVRIARVLYGLAARGWLPARFARVNPRTRTPLLATMSAIAAVVIFALALPLGTLAELTSFAALVVFAVVNGALWSIKKTTPTPPGVIDIPRWLPALGVLVSTAFALFQLGRFAGL